MRDHHTSQHLHANLAGTDTRDCPSEKLLHGIVPMKIDEIFKDLPHLFGIADDILVVEYYSNGKDHNEHYKKYHKYAGR